MLIAYPILSLDQIGIELQHPFSLRSLGHLPLDEISATIERNLLALLAARPVESGAMNRRAGTGSGRSEGAGSPG